MRKYLDLWSSVAMTADTGQGSTPTKGMQQSEYSAIEDALGETNWTGEDEDEGGQGGQDDALNDGSQRRQAADDQASRADGQQEDEPNALEDMLRELSGEEAGDDAGNDDQEGQEGEEGKAGTFAAKSQRIRLEDGSYTTVGELLNERSSHGQLSERETQLREREGKLQETHGHVQSMYEAVQPQLELIATVAKELMPTEPDPALLGTPEGAQTYHLLKAAYDRTVNRINQVVGAWRQNQQLLQTEGQTQQKTFNREEAGKLIQRDKRFGDDKFWESFQRDMFQVGGRVYGYTAEELRNGMIDHRQYMVMRDALAFQKLMGKLRAQKNGRQQAGQEDGNRRPNGTAVRTRVNGSSRRPTNQEVQRAAAARTKFRKEPTIENALLLNF